MNKYNYFIRSEENTGSNKKRKFDLMLFLSTVILAFIGCIGIYSAIAKTDEAQFSKLGIQIAVYMVGIIAALAVGNINYRIFIGKCMTAIITAVGIFLLAAVMIFGVGDGNKAWLRVVIGNTSIGFQPSEFTKISMILLLASFCESVKKRNDQWGMKNVCLFFVIGGVFIALVSIQGDIGSALVYYTIFAAILLLCGVPKRWFWAFLGISAAAIPMVWALLRDYQKNRIIFGFNPEGDPLGYGYQALMSREAILAGGWFGVGYMKGEASVKVPENYTDMIFSVLAEEFGIIRIMVIFLLYITILSRCIIAAVRAYRAGNIGGAVIAVGVMAMIAAQTIENIGMSFGFLPVVGITLPLLSCGGSSLLSTFISLGLVLSAEKYN